MVIGGQMGPQLGKNIFTKACIGRNLLQNQHANVNQTSCKLSLYEARKGIKVCLNKGRAPHQRGDNHKMQI
jgi:hypothetical protein